MEGAGNLPNDTADFFAAGLPIGTISGDRTAGSPTNAALLGAALIDRTVRVGGTTPTTLDARSLGTDLTCLGTIDIKATFCRYGALANSRTDLSGAAVAIKFAGGLRSRASGGPDDLSLFRLLAAAATPATAGEFFLTGQDDKPYEEEKKKGYFESNPVHSLRGFVL